MAEGAERRGEELQHGEGHQLSRALASAGLPSPVDLRHGGGEDVRNAEQALHTLLSFYHRSLDAKEELEEQRRRLHADAKRAEQREHRLQESASQKDKEINRLSHLCEQTKTQSAEDLRKARAERDAAAKKASDLQLKNTQLNHEIKKRDKAHTALQEKYNSMVTGKEKIVKPSLETSGRLKQRATWQKDGSRDPQQAVQRSVAEATQSKLNEVIAENRELKEALETAQKQIRDLYTVEPHVRQPGAGDKMTTPPPTGRFEDGDEQEEQENVDGDGGGAAAAGGDAEYWDDGDGEYKDMSPPGAKVMGLPYKMAREGFERGLNDDIAELRRRLQALSDKPVRRVPCAALPKNTDTEG